MDRIKTHDLVFNVRKLGANNRGSLRGKTLLGFHIENRVAFLIHLCIRFRGVLLLGVNIGYLEWF
jgi:hypothetical protein